MNTIKKICMAVVLCAGALFQADVCAKGTVSSLSSMPTKALVDAEVEEMVNAEADKLTMMTREAQAIIDGANEIIEITKDKSRRGEISRAKAAVIIGEQEYLIKQQRQRLARAVKNAEKEVEEIEAQAGYSLTGLLSGIKSWYYGPEERRSAARSALDELQNEFKNAQEEYTIKMQAADPAAAEQARDEWNAIKQDFENEISMQQKRMSGGMSTGFWTAVAGATALIGGAVAYKYLNQPAKPWEMRSANAQDQAWLDRAMRRQEALEQQQIDATKPSRLERMKESVRGGARTARQKMQSGKKYVAQKMEPYTKPSPESAEQYKKATKSWERQTKAQQEERERLAEQRRQKREAANQPPVAEPVVITLESARKTYDDAKKSADAAEKNLQKAQKAFDDNEAKIERLRSAGATGKNAVEIRNLERKRDDRLSKAVTSANATVKHTQNSLTAAEEKLASVSE